MWGLKIIRRARIRHWDCISNGLLGSVYGFIKGTVFEGVWPKFNVTFCYKTKFMRGLLDFGL